MEWDEDLRYRFRGQFLEQGDNKMMLFAFDEPEMIKVEEIVLPPKESTEEDEGETVKKKIYIFPPEWAGTLDSRLQVLRRWVSYGRSIMQETGMYFVLRRR